MLSHRNKGPAVPSPWASPRGQARGGGTRSRGRGRSGARPGPQGRPGSTPGHRTGLQTAGREARESAPRIRVRATLSPPSPGPLSGASRVPPFLGSWETSPAPAISPPGSFSFQPERVPPHPPARSPRASIAPSAGRGRNKDAWKREAGARGRPASLSSDSPADLWPGAARRPGERPSPGWGSALPAGKLQRRKARVGQNPRAGRPAPLPIPIHPARPVTTSLSLEEEFRRKRRSR